MMKTRSWVRPLALIAVLVLAYGGRRAHAQDHPVVQTGFAADKVYDLLGLDSINTFNGNLTIAIPLGPRYPVGGEMSYGLTLSYNSKVWSYLQVTNLCGGTSGCPPYVTRAEPSHRSNAGMGWLLTMGRLVPAEDPWATDPNGFYQTPDGATHALYDVLHPSYGHVQVYNTTIQYTRDGSYYRKKIIGNSSEIHHPNGTVHTFDATGALISIADASGNGVSVRTITAQSELGALQACSASGWNLSSAWEITDSTSARTHYVCFTDSPRYPKSVYGDQLVKRVVLRAPGEQAAVYEFHYTIPVSPNGQLGVPRGCHSAMINDDGYPDVPVLERLDLPDGSSFAASYHVTEANCEQGTLRSLTLPTGGRIEYDYRMYLVPTGLCGDSGTWASASTAVKTRRLVAGSANPSEWQYSTEYQTPPPGQHVCGETSAGEVYMPNPWETMATVVTAPDGVVQKSWYSVWPYGDASPNGYTYKEFAMPMKRHDTRDGAFLTTEALVGGVRQRASYVQHEYDAIRCSGTAPVTYGLHGDCHDANRRPTKEVIVYHDDGQKVVTRAHSEFDGFGHYRKTVTTGVFDAAVSKTTYTNFNPGTDSQGNRSGALAFGSADRWLLNTFDHQWVGENGRSARSETCFDTKGRLTRRRTLKSLGDGTGSVSRDTRDLLTVLTRDALGNVTDERFYGGDCVPPNSCAAALSTEELCNMPIPGVSQYHLQHTYSRGVRATSHYVENGAALPFKVLDRTIDSSGAITCERDTAEVATCFDYDSMGRVRTVKPSGRAWSTYDYLTTSDPPQVIARRCLSGVSSCTASSRLETRYYYDALGRLEEERRRTGEGSWAATWTTYDQAGRLKTTSVPVGVTSNVSGTMPAGTALTSWSYDGLGRMAEEIRPDGSTTQFFYAGDREKKRRSWIWTNGDGVTASGTDTPVDVIERYDALGRLVSVTENSGATSVTSRIGGAVKTEYEYDVADRLAAVIMNRNGVGPSQRRSFDHDGRGFLAWESQPESGAVSYAYDARGSILAKTLPAADAVSDLRYRYDGAGRLLLVEGRAGGGLSTFRPIKEFAFGFDNTLDDLRKGKLIGATRYNYGRTPFEPVYKIEEMYSYKDAAGRKTDKTTIIVRNPDAAAWQPSRAYVQGAEVMPPIANGMIYRFEPAPGSPSTCISSVSPPSWSTTPGTFVSDGTCRWKAAAALNMRVIKSVSMAASYDDLDLPATVRYPTCVDCGGAPADPDRSTMVRTYDHGRLAGLGRPGAQAFVTGVTYWPNGMRRMLTHGNGISDIQDVGAMARPTQIQFGTYDQCAKPAIVSQPSANRRPGSNDLFLEVSAAGTSTLHYEWFSLTTNGVVGTDSPEITVPDVAADYYVTITNPCGIIRSQVVKVGGCPLPTTGMITPVRQPDESYILRPDPTARADRTYAWRRVPSDAVIAASEELAVPPPATTTTYTLTLQDSCGTSATTSVTLHATPEMSSAATPGMIAVVSGPLTIDISWPAAAGATTYVLERRSGSTWSELARPLGTTYRDEVLESNRTYAYRVYAIGSGGMATASRYSNADVATTRTFTAAVPGAVITPAPANDMLAAVNSVRAAVGWAPVSWSNILGPNDPLPAPGKFVLARHVGACRNRMNEALQALGAPVVGYSPSDLTGAPVRADDINQVQQRAQ